MFKDDVVLPATIKFQYSLPMWMEKKLENFYGFETVDRVYNQYIIMRKKKPNQEPVSRVPKKATSLINPKSDLSLTKQAELLKRCDNIVEFFPEPYSAVPAVRTRLHNMMQHLKTLAERQFVQDFMDEEFSLEAKVK